MRVAICGAQSLFMRGGAELLHENLVTAFTRAGHEAELVRVPVHWVRDQLLPSAFAWRLLQLDADVVVTTNFPSYFVKHPRKVVYLQHQHRAAYDAIDVAWSDFRLDEDSLAVQRELVEWDTRVIAEASARYAQSQCVADRLALYNGLDARVVYHPAPLADRLYEASADGYVFCASRLERNKRPELLVEALAHSRAARLVIAGRGTMHDELCALAASRGVADRLELRGFVDDDELLALYAHASCVAYTPHDEDYGYVPLQAFGAGKPVVTVDDSGGVLEWVHDGETGRVVAADPAAIGAAFDELVGDPQAGSRMGHTGRDRVASLSWSHVVTSLLG